MKIKSLLLVCLFAAAALTARAGNLSGFLIYGPAYTTNNLPVNGANVQPGVILGGAINAFNTWTAYAPGGYSINTANSNQVITASTPSANGFIVTGGQVNTNLWPVRAVNLAPGYPGTLYGPVNNVNIFYSLATVATNASTTNVTFIWGLSNDGTNVVSYHTDVIAIPVISKAATWMTNFTTGGAGWLMEMSESNAGPAAVTNLIIEPGAKAGI
jgi:hypothetical protein